MPNAIERVHGMISQLEEELGSLDHLVFAFPMVSTGEGRYNEPGSVFCAAAIARSREGNIYSEVDDKHPMPSDYIELVGIEDVAVRVPSNSAKKLLKRKQCLVIEKWGRRFVCRVPHRLRDGIGNGTIGLVDVPPIGMNWSILIVKKLQEVSRSLSEERRMSTEVDPMGWTGLGHN